MAIFQKAMYHKPQKDTRSLILMLLTETLADAGEDQKSQYHDISCQNPQSVVIRGRLRNHITHRNKMAYATSVPLGGIRGSARSGLRTARKASTNCTNHVREWPICHNSWGPKPGPFTGVPGYVWTDNYPEGYKYAVSTWRLPEPSLTTNFLRLRLSPSPEWLQRDAAPCSPSFRKA